MRAEQVTDPVCFHGEGPVWFPRSTPRADGADGADGADVADGSNGADGSDGAGALRFVDMLAGDVLRLRPDGQVDREHVGAVAAVLRPRAGGGVVIGAERGFVLQDPDGSLRALPDLWSDKGSRTNEGRRMNEGGCDPDGRFWCGSMAYDQAPGAASLYRLDPDGSVHIVLDRVTVSNGLDWSPDGSLAYYNDTATHQVSVFDYDAERGLTGRRTFVALGEQSPDGLTVDADGGVWTALFGSGVVHRYTPAGALDEVVEVAARQVTACTFGGDDLDELFVTTSREGLEPGDDPLAGSVFSLGVGVRGQPVRSFAG